MEKTAMKKKLTALIPVRKGSQRVPGKNTKQFEDTTLLELKIEVLKKVKGIDEIIVTTDCEKSIEIAKKEGLKVHIRDEIYAGSDITNDKHWRYLSSIPSTDNVILAQVTSPFVKVATYERCINEFNSKAFITKKNSLNSVSLVKDFLWKDGKPLNYKYENTPKSQDLPEIYALNFAITIISCANLEKGNVVATKPSFFELDRVESIDIDDEFDFAMAEFFYRKLGKKYILEEN